MKKYYIVGKGNLSKVIDDVSGNLNNYFELGWELMTTHPEIKKLKIDGVFTDNDVVVTTNPDRKFLYLESFNNVISWEDFLNLGIPESQIIDLVDDAMKGMGGLNFDDIDEILINSLKKFKKDFEIEEKIKNKQFVCLQYRKRNWANSRNIEDDVFESLIKIVSEKYNLDVYVMGLSSEKFCDGNKVNYVNLQQFTTLINNKNCILFFSTMSGPAHLSCYFANKNIIHIVNDLLGQRINGGGSLENHPLYQGRKYNFTNIDVRIIPYKINLNVFEDILIESIKKHNLI